LSIRASDDELDRRVRQHPEFHLELLAEAEHGGWMDWMIEQRCRYGPVRDDEKREHPSLSRFTQLSEADRVKDRTTIRHYPDYSR